MKLAVIFAIVLGFNAVATADSKVDWSDYIDKSPPKKATPTKTAKPAPVKAAPKARPATKAPTKTTVAAKPQAKRAPARKK